eukprot:scaffold15093_cov114-Isochrysis_galbana.AAC.2
MKGGRLSSDSTACSSHSASSTATSRPGQRRASATASPAPSSGSKRSSPSAARHTRLADAVASATPAGAAGVFTPMSMYRTAPPPGGGVSRTTTGRRPADSSERSNTAVRSSPGRRFAAAQPAASKKRRRPNSAAPNATSARNPVDLSTAPLTASRPSRSPSVHSSSSGSSMLLPRSRQTSKCSEP